MAIYLTSDLHLGHDREFVWRVRGFESVQEMNETIVEHWNNTITDEDDVYCLGDLMLGDPSNIEYIKRLNGKIHIVYGNHDTANRQKMYSELPNVVECAWAIMLNYRKYHFFMTHFPCICSNFDDKKYLKQRTINLCGHTHSTDPWIDWDRYKTTIFHCECDGNNCYPWLLDDIIELMKIKYKDVIF